MSAGRKNNSDKKDWNTPPKYIKPIKNFFNNVIGIDPCSNKFSLVNAEKNYIYPTNDGLIDEWDASTVFVNPPYGRNNGTSLLSWFEKAVGEHNKYNNEIIFLIPVATNTKHFKNIIFKHFDVICFLSDTRLKFYNEGVEDKKGAPMACCLCYKGKNTPRFIQIFEEYGKCFTI